VSNLCHIRHTFFISIETFKYFDGRVEICSQLMKQHTFWKKTLKQKYVPWLMVNINWKFYEQDTHKVSHWALFFWYTHWLFDFSSLNNIPFCIIILSMLLQIKPYRLYNYFLFFLVKAGTQNFVENKCCINKNATISFSKFASKTEYSFFTVNFNAYMKYIWLHFFFSFQ